MAELKTRVNAASVAAFVAGQPDPDRRKECRELIALMARATGKKAEMWGTSIVGFGRYQYRYESGRTGEWFEIGFSPRKQALTLYLMSGLKAHKDLLARLGRHKTSVGCLYVRALEDLDRKALTALLRESVRDARKRAAAAARAAKARAVTAGVKTRKPVKKAAPAKGQASGSASLKA